MGSILTSPSRRRPCPVPGTRHGRNQHRLVVAHLGGSGAVDTPEGCGVGRRATLLSSRAALPRPRLPAANSDQCPQRQITAYSGRMSGSGQPLGAERALPGVKIILTDEAVTSMAAMSTPPALRAPPRAANKSDARPPNRLRKVTIAAPSRLHRSRELSFAVRACSKRYAGVLGVSKQLARQYTNRTGASCAQVNAIFGKG